MDPSIPKVSIVLVNWNSITDTLECIHSIKQSTYSNYEIIVVDNGSTDDSVNQLKKIGNSIVLVKNKENLGFTGGNNIGINYAVGHDSSYILLLNNDTIIDSHTIEILIAGIDDDQTVGIVSPKILFYDNSDHIWFAGAIYRKKFINGKMLGYGERDLGQYDIKRTLPFASGCAMMIRREVIENIGGFSDDFFAVMEDIDYSLRAREVGFKIMFIPSALVWHKESISSGGHDSPQYVYYQTRNAFLLTNRISKNYSQRFWARLFIFSYVLRRLIQFLYIRKWWSIAGLVYGLKDGMKKVKGKREYRMLINNKLSIS